MSGKLNFKLTLASIIASAIVLPGCQTLSSAPEANPVLQVPSPDWRDQIIYFVMIDRFNDGDPSNNDQGAGEYNPADHKRYSGGDLKGIQQQLDYVQGMGATALWITPPVANQWYDPYVDYSGYHGYWARDFAKVDEHYGTLSDYQDLSKALHGRGMYLIQDIVINHTGNYSYYPRNEWNGDKVDENFILNDQTPPTATPVQPPFHLNDPRNPEHRQAGIYNFTPVITDFNNDRMVEEWQLSDLDDLNTENPLVRQTLKDSYRYWIEAVGVDAFRVDTAKFVSHDFLNDFFHSDDGVLAQAKAMGKDDFLAFGEIFDYSEALDDKGEKKLAKYLGTAEKPELPSVINFPLQGTFRRVFANGYPTSHLGYRLKKMYDVYPDPTRLPTFLDNHDMDRFIKGGTDAGLHQALTAMLTLPGIPVIYQGTAQGFTEQRRAMFAGGHHSEGKDHFDTSTDFYQQIAQLTELRKSHPAFTRGDLNIIAENENQAGIFAYTRSHKGKTFVVIMNTATHDLLAPGIGNFKPGQQLTGVYASHGEAEQLIANEQGQLTLALPAQGSFVFKLDKKTKKAKAERPFTNQGFFALKPLDKDQMIKGTVQPGIDQLQLVIDGDLSRALDAQIQGDRWSVTMPIDYFPVGDGTHRYTIYEPNLNVAWPEFKFETTVEASAEETLAQVDDPEGDDRGAGYPLDRTFEDRQMDILAVKVARSDLYLDVYIKPKSITTYWSGPNGFDHVRYHILFDLPNQDQDARVMPFVQADMPEGSWDLLSVSDGWTNNLYSAKGSGAKKFGTAASPAPTLKVLEDGWIKYRFNAALFGKTRDIVGGKIYITTWDYDGVGGLYRPISANGGQYEMIGPNPKAPLIMDDIWIDIP